MRPLTVKSPARIKEIILTTTNWVKRGSMVKSPIRTPSASVWTAYEGCPKGCYIQVFPSRLVLILGHKNGVYFEARK